VKPTRAGSGIINAVHDDSADERAKDFARCVDRVNAAVQRFRRNNGHDPSELYGAPIERAVSGIVDTCNAGRDGLDSRHVNLIVAGLAVVAQLHYARFHSSPHKPAAYWWSAVYLFRMIRPAPRLPVRIPSDVELILDVLAAEDLAVVPGLEDPVTAADTAGRIAEYAVVQRDVGALSRAELLLRRVLDAIPVSDPNHVVYLGNLVNVLVMRWEWTGADLAEEIIAGVDTIADTVQHADPRWPQLQATAGSACYVAAVRTQRRSVLHQAVDLLSRAVTAMPEDQPAKAGFLQNLARAELLRWAWDGNAGSLEDAAASLRHAIGCTVPGDPGAADRHTWLAHVLLAGDRPDSAEATRHLEAAESLRHVSTVRVNGGLLGETWLLLWHTDPRADTALDRAIDLLGQAEADPAQDHRDTLAEALWQRWERTRDIDDVDVVIARLTTRVKLTDIPPLMLNLLARSLRARWERTGDSIAIRHAIHYLTAAVERSPAGVAATCMYLNNLGSMWLRLHQATAERSALEQAVRYAQRALMESKDGDSGRPMYANTAAIAHLTLWAHTGADGALQLAVDISRLAVSVTPTSHPDWAAHLANLGAALINAAIQFDNSSLLEEAVQALQSAVRHARPDHPGYGGITLNLGQALLIWGRTHGDADAASRGRNLLRQSVDQAHIRPEDAIRAARRWADEAAAADDWRAAADALSSAVDRLASLPGHRLHRSDHEKLLVRLAGIATDASAACINDDNNCRAVECLESGRGVLLAKTLHDDRALGDLHRRDAALAIRIRQLQELLVTE
jgi:tetratricopeptide (TPR) repeat protein